MMKKCECDVQTSSLRPRPTTYNGLLVVLSSPGHIFDGDVRSIRISNWQYSYIIIVFVGGKIYLQLHFTISFSRTAVSCEEPACTRRRAGCGSCPWWIGTCVHPESWAPTPPDHNPPVLVRFWDLQSEWEKINWGKDIKHLVWILLTSSVRRSELPYTDG